MASELLIASFSLFCQPKLFLQHLHPLQKLFSVQASRQLYQLVSQG